MILLKTYGEPNPSKKTNSYYQAFQRDPRVGVTVFCTFSIKTVTVKIIIIKNRNGKKIGKKKP
jgi:protoheme ferro-lyase